MIAEATVLARRFGLPGLPVGGRETVPAGELVRAACVRAFLGTPELVLIADASLEASANSACRPGPGPRRGAGPGRRCDLWS